MKKKKPPFKTKTEKDIFVNKWAEIKANLMEGLNNLPKKKTMVWHETCHRRDGK